MSDNVSSTTPALAPGLDTEGKPLHTTTPSTSSTADGADITTKMQNVGASAMNSAQATMSSISNSQALQDLKNGPVAQNVSNEASKTTSEFKDLYGSKTVPAAPAATGQELTQYHSMFYRLLTWENPRATGITFVATLIFILTCRYLNVLHYALKGAYFILGITASLEVAGKLIFDDGLATKMRPRKYWTIPRASLERSLDDFEQLVNFFVIETQRIVYAENVYATVGVFLSALVSYWLIKLVPFWGLAFITTCVAYLGPLVYIMNKDAIDGGLEHAGSVVGAQATQLKNVTAEQTGRATDTLKSYTAEYTNKAQEYIGQKKTEVDSKVSSSDFPAAPKQEPIVDSTPLEREPLLQH